MTEQTKRAAVAVVTACSVLLVGAFAPTQQPQAADDGFVDLDFANDMGSEDDLPF